MTLPLTVDTLRAAYDFLATTPPFNKWNLPDGEDITFQVVSSTNLCGRHWSPMHESSKDIIAISRKLIRTNLSLMTTMAHEMCHVHQRRHMRKEREHGPAFNRMADEVCLRHHFDRGLF